MHRPVKMTYYQNCPGKHVYIYFSRRNTPSLTTITSYIVVYDLSRGMLCYFLLKCTLFFLESVNAKTCYFSDSISNH